MAKVKRLASCLGVFGLFAGIGFFASSDAWAVGNYDLVGCINGADEVCTLTDDVVLTESLMVNRAVTIDLNNHSITPGADNFDMIYVDGASPLTVTGTGVIGTESSASPFRVLGSENSEDAEYSVLNIEQGVTLKADDYAIWIRNRGTSSHSYGVIINFGGTIDAFDGIYINGKVQDTEGAVSEINILNSASITTTEHAVYAAGYAHWTFGSATITAVEGGVGMKAGTFEFNNTTVTATGEFESPEAYGNGIHPSGAALQLETNAGYADHIELTINGGTYTSEKASTILEYVGATTIKTLVINDGVFSAGEGKEIFETSTNFNKTHFVNGGVFNTVFDPSYLAEGKSAYEKPADTWTVDAAEEYEVPDEIIIKKDETYTLSLGETIDKYAVTGMVENEFVTLSGLTVTGVSGGSALLNVQVHEMGKGLDQTVPVYVVEVGTENADDAPDSEVRATIAASVAEDLEEMMKNNISQTARVLVSDIEDIKDVYRAGGQIIASMNIEAEPEEYWEGGEAFDQITGLLESGEQIGAVFYGEVALTSSLAQSYDPLGLASELANPVEMRFLIPEELRNAPEGMTRIFTIIRGHEDINGNETAERLATERDGDEVVTQNALFSDFALVYKDVANTPDTGTFTAVSGSAMVSAIVTSIVVGVITSITTFATLIRRRY